MPILTITHHTGYAYRQPVSFGEHRIFVRPRESYDQRLIESRLDIFPEPSELRWLHDVFGNSVAIARFDKRSTSLRFDSWVRMEHNPVQTEEVALEDYARLYPFSYSSEDMADLLRSIERQYPDRHHELALWARQFVGKGGSLFIVVEEDYWATLEQVNVNDITTPFGITFASNNGDQSVGGHSNAGKITKQKYSIPYAGARKVEGGTPFAFSNDSQVPFGVFTNVNGGGKVVAMGEGMVSLYMTSWKDVKGYQCAGFMDEVIGWLVE